MLKDEHGDHFMIYNLSERYYDTSKFNNQVLFFINNFFFKKKMIRFKNGVVSQIIMLLL